MKSTYVVPANSRRGCILGFCARWSYSCLFIFLPILCAQRPTGAQQPVAEPLVLEFDYAQVRQEILVSEGHDFHVLTNTDVGQVRASGHIGTVSDGHVDLALTLGLTAGPGSREQISMTRRLRLGEFSDRGVRSGPLGWVLWYLWVRRGIDPVPALVETLRRGDRNAVVAAGHLARLGPAARAAVPDLIDVLKPENRLELRERAAVALGQIGPEAKDARVALEPLLARDQPVGLRVAAAAALWKIVKHRNATPTLIAALCGSEKAARLKALEAVREMGVEAPAAGPVLVPMLQESDATLRAGAAGALWATTRDTRAVDTLVAMLEGEPRGHAHAREALARIGFPGAHRATEALAAEAFSSNSIHRWYVGKVLPQVDPDASRSVAAISTMLRQRGPDAVEQASDVLAHFGATVVPRLRELLDSDDERVRQLAFYALWRIGSPAVDTLAEALGHRKAEVRRKAAVWLRDVEADISPIVPYLIRALDDDVAEVRSEAASTLVEIGRPAMAALQQVLQSPNPRTRELGEQILRGVEERGP